MAFDFHFCIPSVLLLLLSILCLSFQPFFVLSHPSSSPNCSNSNPSASPIGPLFSDKIIRRLKRQWNYSPMQFHCPPSCFSCTPMHCQAYQCIQPQVMPMARCCCRQMIIQTPQTDLKTACDGEEAVAACLNGLCGQGYFCQRAKYCCRCPVGKSIGRCVNGMCPVGYVCNSNDFCCAIGITGGGAIGSCENGECPEGFECGEGDLCYPNSVGTSFVPTRNFPLAAGRIKRPYWATKTRRRGAAAAAAQRGRKNSGTKRQWWAQRENPWEVRRTRGWTDGAWEESGEQWADSDGIR